MSKRTKPKVVVIGGGTGTSVVLSGLKQFDLDISAVISVADSGGSTGRLRDEFGFLPVGDLRQGLAALATDSQNEWAKKLLLYRFSKGSGLEGHNLGNLILTALQDMTGSTPKALEVAHSIFRLHGKIIPVTEKNIQLVIEYEDGTVEIGEKTLDEKHGGERIAAIKTSPKSALSPAAGAAIRQADLIVIGPGDLYGSILPNLIVDGFAAAIVRSKAKLVYILNLMTRYTQTHGFKASDHIREIEARLGKKLDAIIVSTSAIPEDVLTMYAAQHEYPVLDDIKKNSYQIIRMDLSKPAAARNYLRHDPDKLANVIMNLC